MAPLGAALALAGRRKGLSVHVAKDLHLDVPWLCDVALQVHTRIGETCGAAVRARRGSALQRGLVVNDLHPDPAAAASGFDDNRIANRSCRIFRTRHGVCVARRNRFVRVQHWARSSRERHVTGLPLHRRRHIEDVRRGTDEDRPRVRDGTRKG